MYIYVYVYIYIYICDVQEINEIIVNTTSTQQNPPSSSLLRAQLAQAHRATTRLQQPPIRQGDSVIHDHIERLIHV